MVQRPFVYDRTTPLGETCASVLREAFALACHYADVPVSCVLIRARLGMTDPALWERVTDELKRNGHALLVADVGVLTLTQRGTGAAAALAMSGSGPPDFPSIGPDPRS